MLEIKKAKGGYIVYLKASNGEILMTSEILKTTQNAFKNAQSALVNMIRFGAMVHFGKDVKKEVGNLWSVKFDNACTLGLAKYLYDNHKFTIGLENSAKKSVKKKSAPAKKKAPVKKSTFKSQIIVNKKGKKVSVTKK